MDSIAESAREVPIVADVDVCVIGGGPTGLVAALAASRQGCSVMLVEMQGFLGGMATAGLIGPILGHTASRSSEPTLGGIPREICVRMADMGHAAPWEDSLKMFGVPFDSEAFKIVADRMVAEAGMQVMLHTFFVDSITADQRLTHAIVESKSGRRAIAARVFVDATGDADVGARAGAEYTKGRPADGKPMAMGSMFHIGGLEDVDDDTRQAMREAAQQAISEGKLNLYNPTPGVGGSTYREGRASCNVTRFGGDPTDVKDLTEGEFATRRMAWDLVQLWKSVPGAEKVHLLQTPAHVGLRESRQIVGEFRITGEDVVEGSKYDDSVARCGYWIDIHCPRGLVDGGDVHLCSKNCAKKDCYMITDYIDQLPDELYPPDGEWFDIPYRTLVPRDIDGLLVAGRCISADYQAMGAMRVMGPCMATGEAAGTAAAMAADAAMQPREVDTEQLRDALTEAGALV